jgi:hypothetical protein
MQRNLSLRSQYVDRTQAGRRPPQAATASHGHGAGHGRVCERPFRVCEHPKALPHTSKRQRPRESMAMLTLALWAVAGSTAAVALPPPPLQKAPRRLPQLPQPRRLPAGPLIVGYGTSACDERKMIAEAVSGVNVIIWFAITLGTDASTGKPAVRGGQNHTCVAAVAAELRRRGLPTSHMISVGGWDAPHPNTSFSGAEWWEVWEAWNAEEAASSQLGFPGCACMIQPCLEQDQAAGALGSGRGWAGPRVCMGP